LVNPGAHKVPTYGKRPCHSLFTNKEVVWRVLVNRGAHNIYYSK
jgi:hypothetical protein